MTTNISKSLVILWISLEKRLKSGVKSLSIAPGVIRNGKLMEMLQEFVCRNRS